MPAVMVLRSITNPVPDSPGRWLAGEIVTIGEQDKLWGFKEMPLREIGTQSVATINGLNPVNIPLYAHVITADAGTITQGNQPDFDVEAGTSIVWQFGDIFTNYGVRTNTTPGNFYHIRVADKTVEEVNLYLEVYNKKLEYQTDQYDPGTQRRRWTTTNIRVSASGNNGFTAQGIADTITEFNTNNPDHEAVLLDTDNLTYFQVENPEGFTMPPDEYQDWQDTTQAFALADYYARRRWYIIQAGLDSLAANNGTISGDAADVVPFLRDGLLD